MPITAGDLVPYLSANRPEDDTTTSGGAIDQQRRPTFTQLTSITKVMAVSTAADSRNITFKGRDITGIIVQETVALNGTTPVTGALLFERLLDVSVAASGTQTVTVSTAPASGAIGTIPPTELAFRAMFIASVSSTSPVTRYEKQFWKNAHATLTLQVAKTRLSADPLARIRVGVAATKNDTLSVANRLTAPGGIAFVDDGVDQNVPGTTLEAGSFVGLWVEEGLLASDPPMRGTFTTQINGNTA